MADAGILERAAQSLLTRGLADHGTFRPDRELSRRLLIVSQPDARIVLVDASRQGRKREVDVYERAGAHVPYRGMADGHELGEVRELEDVEAKLIGRFRPRATMGDYFDLTFSASEYFVFSLLAGDLSQRRHLSDARGEEPPSGRIRVKDPTGRMVVPRQMSISDVEGPGAPISGVFEDDGTPIAGLLRRLPTEIARTPGAPDQDSWNEALSGLERMDIVTRKGNFYALRPALHDLALGLATQKRSILTRFDFGADDWIARDATFVDVPGSLFMVRALDDQAISIIELDDAGLEAAVNTTIRPLGPTP